MIKRAMDNIQDRKLSFSSKTHRPEEYCVHVHCINCKCIAKYSASTFGRCFICKEKKKHCKTYSICLICGQQFCHNSDQNVNHIIEHYESNKIHNICLDLSTFQIWCFECSKGFAPDSMLSIKSFLKKAAAFSKNNQYEKIIKSIPKPRIPLGLQNMGYTCYMNSVLQCLFVLIDFRECLFTLYNSSLHFKIEPNESTKLHPLTIDFCQPFGPISKELNNLFQDLFTANTKYISPSVFCQAMKTKMAQFNENSMHDSHEYLLALLDCISFEVHKKTITTIKNSLSGASDSDVSEYTKSIPKCFPDILFCGTMSSELICLECEDKVIRSEPFLDLSLPINITNKKFVQSNSAFYYNIISPESTKKIPLNKNNHLAVNNDDKYSQMNSKEVNLAKSKNYNLNLNESVLPGGHNIKQFKNKNAKEKRRNFIDKFFPALNPFKVISSKKEILSDGANINSEPQKGSKLKIINDPISVSPKQIPLIIVSNQTKNINNFNSGKGDPRVKPYTKIFTKKFLSESKNGGEIIKTKSTESDPTIKNLILSEHLSPRVSLLSSADEQLNTSDPADKLSSKAVQGRVFRSMSLSSRDKSKNKLFRSLSLYNLNNNVDHSLISLMQHCKLNSAFHSCTSSISRKQTESIQTQNIPEASLYHSLNRFFASEILDKNNRVQCASCSKVRNKKVYCNTKKTLRILKLPNIIVIHFKRFKEVGNRFAKMNDHMEFPIDLDLSNYCDLKQNPHPMFTLYGVIEHTGNLSHGHYIAYIRYTNQTPGEEPAWYIANDHLVKMTSTEAVLKSNAYLLFYQMNLQPPNT